MATATREKLQGKLQELIEADELRSVTTVTGRHDVTDATVEGDMLAFTAGGQRQAASIDDIREVNDQGVGWEDSR